MKKSLRSVISVLLSVLLMVLAFPVSVFSYVENSEYRYTVEDGEVKILDYLGHDTHIVIPSTIDELPVKAIGERAFQQVSGIRSVTVPASIEVMEGNVFDFNPTLTDVFVDDNNPFYKSVDGILFTKDMSTLLFYPDGKAGDSYTVPEGVTVLAPMAFGGCDNLLTVELPEGLLFIGQNAFFMNDGIEEIHLPESLVGLGDEAFDYCDNLHTLTFGKNIEYIGEEPFNRCPALKTLTISPENENYKTIDGVLYSSMDELVRYPEDKEYTEEYYVLEGTEVIGKNAFFSCRNIGKVILPDSVKHIDEYAFYHSSVSDIDFGDNLGVIASGAFYDNQNLLEVTIPESVYSIEDSAFGACIDLKKAHLPATLDNLGTDVFNNCVSLEEVELPENIKTIPENTFRYCLELTELPDLKGAETIGEAAFAECHRLRNITIPQSVTSIETHAFANCRSLRTVIIGPNVTTFGGRVFQNEYFDVTIIGYKGTAAETYALENNHPFQALGEDVTLPDDDVTLPDDDVTLPDDGEDGTETIPPQPFDEMILVGDSDLSGKITIKDATLIQKQVANLVFLNHKNIFASDADLSGVVNVKDATLVQKHLASISTTDSKVGILLPYQKGEGGYVYIKNTANWSNVYCYCWNDNSSIVAWPGEKAELVSEVDGVEYYRYYVPGIYHNIIVGSGVNDEYSADSLVNYESVYDTEKDRWSPLLKD